MENVCVLLRRSAVQPELVSCGIESVSHPLSINYCSCVYIQRIPRALAHQCLIVFKTVSGHGNRRASRRIGMSVFPIVISHVPRVSTSFLFIVVFWLKKMQVNIVFIFNKCNFK